MEPIKLEFILKGDIDKELSRINLAIKGVGDQSYASFSRLLRDSDKSFTGLSAGTRSLATTLQDVIGCLRANEQAQRALYAEYEKGSMSAAEYADAQARLSVQQTTLRDRASELARQIESEVRQNNMATGSLNQKLSLLGDLQRQYAGLTEAERNNTAVGGALATQIKGLNNEITAIQANLRQEQQVEALVMGSLRQKQTLLGELQLRYAGLSEAERNNAATGGALATQVKQLNNEITTIQANLRQEQQVEALVDGSLQERIVTLSRLREEYAKLGKAERESMTGTNLVTQIREVDEEITRMQANMGRVKIGATGFNSLGMSVQQVARELPSLTMGANMFFLAISNNLPILADELRRARVEFDNLKKTNQAATPVWKQVLSSIMSWQTALVVGITLLSVYGKDIPDWARGLLGADQAQKGLNESMTDFNSILSRERQHLRSLFSDLDRARKGTEGYRRAINDINAAYGKYLPNLLSEKSSLREIEEAYRLVNKSLRENAALKAQGNAIDKVLEKSIKVQSEALTGMREIATEKLGELKSDGIVDIIPGLTEDFRTAGKTWEDAWRGVSARIQSELGGKKLSGSFFDELEDYVRSVYKSEKQISDIQRQFNPFFNKEAADKAVVLNKRRWEEIKAQADSTLESIASDQRRLLDDGKTDGIDPATVQKYKAARREIDRATKELSIYDPYDKQQKEADKLLGLTDKMNRSILENDLKLQSGRISILEDGKAKRIASAGQEAKDTIAAIQKEREEYRQKAKESKVKEDPTVIKTFDDREAMAKTKEKADIAKIDKEYADEYKERAKALTDVLLNEEQRKLSAIKDRYDKERKWADEQLRTGGITKDEHKSYTADMDKAQQQETYRSLLDNLNDHKRQEKDLREKWDTDIATAVEAKDAYLAARLMEGKQKALSSLNSQMLQESTEWIRLFGNLDTLTVDELNKLIDKIQAQVDSGAIKMNPVDLKAFMDSLNEAKEKVAEKSPFEALAKSSGEMKKALADLKKAEDDGLSGEELDVYKRKVKDTAENVKRSIAAIGEVYGQLSDTMKSAAELIGMVDEGLGETVNNAIALGDAVMNVGEVVANAVIAFAAGMNAMETASVILLVIKAVIMAVMAAMSLFNGDKRHEKKIKDMQKEVDSLSRAYDRLGRSIENTYSDKVYGQMDDQVENLKRQQQLVLRQMREEQEKKHTDDDKAREYKDKYEELGDQAEDLKKKQIEMLAGTDVQSAIDDFADALMEAYAQGEDGAEAMGETTKKVLANAVKEALKKQLLGDALKNAVTQLGKDMGDGVLSDEDKGRFEDSAKSAGDRFMEAMRMYDDLFKGDEPTREASAKGIASISQDSVDRLNGSFSTQLIFLDRTLVEVTGIREQTRFIYGLQVEGWKDVRAIRELSGKVAENTGRVAEISERIESLSGQIASNTKSTANGIKDMNDKGMRLRDR